jgi:signal transduction histidine kinase
VIRTAVVSLLFAGVALRALVHFSGDPQRFPAVTMLFVYGLILVVGPNIIQRSRTLHHAPNSHRPYVLPFVYLLLQAGLVSALLRVPTTRDFIAALFIPLSLDAVLYFGPRTGFLWIVAYSLVMVGPLISTEDGPFFGVAMTALFGVFCFLSGGYAYQLQKAEAARRHNQSLISKLQAAHRQLQSYVNQVEEVAAEHERGRLARELHDSVTQTVFSMNLAIQGACLLFAREPGRVAAQLERLEALAASAMGEIKALVLQLRPPSVAAEGLPDALRSLVAERLMRDGLQVSLEVTGERVLPPPVSIALYAVAQEALNNVTKHAGTGQALVRLNLADSGTCLEIQDSGPGFELEMALKEPGHLGLTGMTDQAREIGWNLVVDSVRGRGTRIRVEERAAEAAH